MKKQWLETLYEEALVLIDNGYTVGPAIEKAWDSNYDSIAVSSVDFNFAIGEVRDLFWDEGFNRLEEYEESIIANYEEEDYV